MKIRPRTTRPRTAGSAPGSPVRSRPIQSRIATGIVRSSMSSEKPEGWEVIVCSSDALVGGSRRETEVATPAGSDQLDDLGGAAVLGLHLGCDPAQVERAHP